MSTMAAAVLARLALPLALAACLRARAVEGGGGRAPWGPLGH